MTNIGEKIAFGDTDKEEETECPFKKGENPSEQSEKCGAKKLGENRKKTKYEYGEKIEIKIRETIFKRTSYGVHITAHHVIPCGSWGYKKDDKKCANTKLLSWIDEKNYGGQNSQISKSVGYDVNNGKNGVYLPSNYLYCGDKKKWASVSYRKPSCLY